MPRPKKAGAPQPKKRSRNGCWPCKSRKVKCDEAHPSCLNCQRQGETCDYSIRLNWEGRGKKKTEGDGATGGQIIFSSNTITSTLGKLSSDSIMTPTLSEQTAGASPITSMTIDSPEASSGYAQSQRPSTAGSLPPIEPYTNFSPSPTALRYPQSLQSYPARPSSDSSMIDPTLMNHSPIAEDFPSGPYERSYPPATDLSYTQSYERYHHPMTTKSNGLVQQAAITRFRADSTRRNGPPSPSEQRYESPSDFLSNEQDTPALTTHIDNNNLSDIVANTVRRDMAEFNRPFKRMRYDYTGQDIHVPSIPAMAPPHPAIPPYAYSNILAPISGSGQPQLGVPLTPTASSTYSDDSLKTHPAKLSPYSIQENKDDPRRLSVESLLSGPAGMPFQQPSRTSFSNLSPETSTYRSHHSTSSSTDTLEEMTTWGTDRGFRDLDEGKNDDANAISGGSPISMREHLDLELNSEGDYVPTEFGFGIQAKDTAFEKGNYYQRPITIRLPKSFEPLPNLLMENPMNLLYFHHFISHTARILVPHHCSANPFQNILPKMALQDPNLMHLLLAYSASHRARLLQQPEPAVRIARWVRDIFPNLRHDLNDPTRIVSNSNLATAIMLASLEIISPKAFGVAIPWQKHLGTARQIIAARGGAKSIHRDRSQASDFLLRWFAYLDVLGSLIGGPSDLPSASGSVEGAEYDLDDDDEESDYQIDCLLGFTSRCVSILAKIAHLAKACDNERIDDDQNIRPDWKVDEKTEARAEKLIVDLENARTNTRIQPCPHLHSAGEAAYQWDFQEMQATNAAYHYAGLVHVHRRILGKPSSHADVQTAVREISGALYKVRKGSTAESCLLFPMFTAGCDALDEKQRNAIMDRFRGVEDFGMSHVYNARTLMQRVWDTGKPWETLVSGEFVG